VCVKAFSLFIVGDMTAKSYIGLMEIIFFKKKLYKQFSPLCIKKHLYL